MTKKKRVYRSSARQRQAVDTRGRIADAAYQLLEEKHYEGMTIDAIAKRADVSPQTVYAVFRSKAGILAELLDRTAFGAGYQELVQEAMEEDSPPVRLRYAARIARHILSSRSAALDLLQGASLVTPELAKILHERESRRYENQKPMIDSLSAQGWLRREIGETKARDILWSLTAGELYGMLVHQRKWTPQQYEDWLGDVLVASLLKRPAKARTKSAAGRR